MKIKIFLFLALITQIAKAQIIHLDNVRVGTVISKMNYETLGNRDSGPYIYIFLGIINNTDSTIILQPSKSSFFFDFSCNGKSYIKETGSFYLMNFYGKEEIALLPNTGYRLEFGSSIFGGTDILTDERLQVYDYSREILQALPTLKIVYEDPNYKFSSSGGIGNVVIGEDYYYTPK